VYLTELVEPCGALPRKCLFIYLDYSLKLHGSSWMNLAGHAALAGRSLFREDGPEILDQAKSEEDHGDVVEIIYASGCNSFDQSRLTEERTAELRRRALAQQSPGRDSSGVALTYD
jgi:hypothetical protein